jgi:4-hydroxy-tetrahydrodipicolinate reductase
MIRVALCGAAGRMGAELARAIASAEDLELAAAIEMPGHAAVGTSCACVAIGDDLAVQVSACDLVIDFTTARASARHLETARAAGVPFLTGTTGFSEGEHAAFEAAARTIPVLWASNMSLGITAACQLLRQAARRLPGYDVEIVEFHHRRKRDAPSGTALHLAEIVRGERAGTSLVHGRAGETGERPVSEIGIHALRGGDVVGEHRVIFAGPGERLEVRHVADHRGCFVTGALAAARFLPGRPPGLYDMEDVLAARG